MLKLLGGLLVLAACWSGGMFFSVNLSKRSFELERCVAFVTMLGEQLRYTLAPMDQIISHLARRQEFSALGFVEVCSQFCSGGQPFPQAFGLALEARPGHLTGDDILTLRPLGETLGAVNLEGQLSAIQLCGGLLRDRLAGVREKRKTHGNMYPTLGLLAGAALVIITL